MIKINDFISKISFYYVILKQLDDYQRYQVMDQKDEKNVFSSLFVLFIIHI